MAKNSVAPQAPTVIVINNGSDGPSFIVRALWFLFIGWWLSGIAIGVAYFACLTIIGLPLGFVIFNALPAIITLRARSKRTSVEVKDGVTYVTGGKVAQLPLWARALWFVLVGWWAGGIYLGIAWLLCVSILGLPVGLLMFNRTGAVMTLLKY